VTHTLLIVRGVLIGVRVKFSVLYFSMYL
jgi:hypothetical protein